MVQQTLHRKHGQALAASLKSTLIGTGGTVVVAMFLMTVLPLEAAFTPMPWVIAFTGALTGFRCIEMLKTVPMKGFKRLGCLTGMLAGGLAWTALNVIGFHATGFIILTPADLLICSTISGVTGCLGSMLALRHYHL